MLLSVLQLQKNALEVPSCSWIWEGIDALQSLDLPGVGINATRQASLVFKQRSDVLNGAKKCKKPQVIHPTPKLRNTLSIVNPLAPLPGAAHAQPATIASLRDVTKARLSKKYGKWGRVLGSGVGCTVRLIKGRNGAVYAVKEFRPKHNGESDKQYRKEVTAEFCVGSTLKHPNIIETVDIVLDRNHYYLVMEFVPFDLFSAVISGNMSRPEIYCIFRQICDGVEYLHEVGLAHRDLKLDNCLMASGNVVKIIEFGTAIVFHYPGKAHTLATGIVGSDPYLAPEVLDGESYDPRKTDVWSLGVIFICMVLRRFPWKTPDPKTDPSFKVFVAAHPDLSVRPPSKPAELNGTVATSSEVTPTVAVPEPAPPAVTPTEPESIFRLLPRETRPTLSRMLCIAPASRCTLSDLLKGRGKTSGLLCGCRVGAVTPPVVQPLSDAAIVVEDGIPVDAFTEGPCVDHDVAEEDDGDVWLLGIESCAASGVAAAMHGHIKVQVTEK
ncbi:hypothetical protein HYPSUDRAFT_140817 [Hypholoma sublateritium FD-334 SS-4]|uniref:non-specific serine/threonine protein kinase n=1 Tax=Hypholoma sublateritium (strain FD-334 SS-4) TaxID=945553 RepID=A0A0D2MCR8_HYPSF|nr:hypothetical protein HYPSUDRAFT_140817 [Hypholoma sublateritium FD-334 SS-4]